MAKNQKKTRSKPTSNLEKNEQQTTPISFSENPPHLLLQAESWISARLWWVSAAIFLVSIGIRTAYFQEARDTPAGTMHRWSSSDMEFYDASAKRLASGDWLLDTAMQPFHSWHNELAKLHFEKYPDEAAPFYARSPKTDGSSADTLAARRLFMSEQFQGKVFYQEPLYAYLVAATYKICGTDPHWVYLWQMLLGALTNVLVFWVARRWFGSVSGGLAALLVMLSGPVLIYEMTLLRSTLTAFLTLISLHFFQKTTDSPSLRNHLILGGVAAISLLNQSYFLLFWLPALAWLAWQQRSVGRAAAMRLAAMAAAFLLACSPLFYRNAKVGAPVFSTAGAGAMVYVLYNSSHAQPLEPNFFHAESAVELAHQSHGSLLAAVSNCLASFEKKEDLWRVYKKKLQSLFLWMENPNNVSYYMFRQYSPTLAALPAPYFWLAPLGICGFFIGFWQLRWRFLPFFLMWMASASPLFLSASLARYRVAFVILTTILAAFFVVELLCFFFEKRWKIALSSFALLAIVYLFTSSIRPRDFFVYFPNDILPMYFSAYADRLLALEKAGDNEGFVKLSNEFLQYIPDHFFDLNINSKIHASNEEGCARDVARLLTMHATMLERAGQQSEAGKFKERAEILKKLADDFAKRRGR